MVETVQSREKLDLPHHLSEMRQVASRAAEGIADSAARLVSHRESGASRYLFQMGPTARTLAIGTADEDCDVVVRVAGSGYRGAAMGVRLERPDRHLGNGSYARGKFHVARQASANTPRPFRPALRALASRGSIR